MRKNGVVNRKINLIYYNILEISRCIILTAMVINDIHSKLNIYICKPFESKITFQFNFQFTFISSSLIDNFFTMATSVSIWVNDDNHPRVQITSSVQITHLLFFCMNNQLQTFVNVHLRSEWTCKTDQTSNDLIH